MVDDVSKRLPRGSLERFSSIFEAPEFEKADENSPFEAPDLHKPSRTLAPSVFEETVEATVEDASKLFRSRWPRSGVAGNDFARSRSATDEGSIDR